MAKKKSSYLFEGAEWDFDTIKRTYDAIEKIALKDFNLNVYPNQIEIISSEQMLDCYSSIGLPIMYSHWSFGKHFVRDEALYRTGRQNLAYEIVSNTVPCISYLMEENSMTMQTLVMAHAAFGHNHVFKNNYLFKQWTDADHILDYLMFAKDYIAKCEEKYGYEDVEKVLDAAHALMAQGVDKFQRPGKISIEKEREYQKNIEEYEAKSYDELLDVTTSFNISKNSDKKKKEVDNKLRGRATLPEENILYFIEKNSPSLKVWQKEIVRIVRKISQYFYPQKMTKVLNEGMASFTHYNIMNKLWDDGLINDGSIQEFIQSHTGVIYQPKFDSKYYSGFNPYALGFAIFNDIKRICENPTEEDKTWFDFAGDDWKSVTLDAVANYRDDSFILQYLSPKVIRDFRLFGISDEEDNKSYEVLNIHNDAGYRKIRSDLSSSYNIANYEPDIQVTEANLSGSRTLVLRHKSINNVLLDEDNIKEVIKHIKYLWGYDVVITTVNDTNTVVKRYSTSPQ